jgi:hypothetical protein
MRLGYGRAGKEDSLAELNSEADGRAIAIEGKLEAIDDVQRD